jgi:hypothetical protein
MNQIKIYQVLENHGFGKEDAQLLVDALNERDTEAATKGDLKDLSILLKSDIKDLELRMTQQFVSVHKEMGNQTNRFIAGVAIIGVIFKLADLFIHKLGGSI